MILIKRMKWHSGERFIGECANRPCDGAIDMETGLPTHRFIFNELKVTGDTEHENIQQFEAVCPYCEGAVHPEIGLLVEGNMEVVTSLPDWDVS